MTALTLAVGSVSSYALVMLHEMDSSSRRCSAINLCSCCGLKQLEERNGKQQSRITKVSSSQNCLTCLRNMF